MDSSIIGKIDKARRYAEEPERVSLTSFRGSFHGDHNTYEVGYDSGVWNCQCHFFATRGVCSHTMALQRMLEGLLDQAEKPAAAV